MDKYKFISQRIRKLRKLLKKKKINLFFISNQTNISYLTGLNGLSKSTRELFILISPSSAILFLSPLLKIDQQLEEEFKMKILEKKETVSQTLKKIIQTVDKKELAFESENLTVAELTRLKQKVKANFIPTSGIIEQLREIKDEFEIEKITKACKITTLTWKKIKPQIIPEKSEVQISELIVSTLKKFGAEGIPADFYPIVASSINSSIPHHISSQRRIQKKDVVLVDFGCTVEGYCSDMTRTIKMGGNSKKFTSIKSTVMQAYQKSLSAISIGSSVQRIDSIVRTTLSKYGYKNRMPHATGHGVGLEVHEKPLISYLNKKKEKIKTGMVVAVEPAIYIPNKFGFRYENTILIEENKIINLTET